MENLNAKNNGALYRCVECGFQYSEEAIAKQCEAWCKEHHSCNLEITKHAIENKAS